MPEGLLWRELRQAPGIKFRRQHPIGPYVLDFYCASAKMCIEIDGRSHDMGDRPALDEKRDIWLREQGICVERIDASEVLAAPAEVADRLVRLCGA